jgi:hypothetical protein
MFGKMMAPCVAITKEFFENEICAMYATRRNSLPAQALE